MRYNEAVQEYNTSRGQFPANLTAKMFGFKEYPFFQAPPEAQDRCRRSTSRNRRVAVTSHDGPAAMGTAALERPAVAARRCVAGERYLLTDFRLAARHARRRRRDRARRHRRRFTAPSRALDRLLGTSTIAVHPRGRRRAARPRPRSAAARSSPRCSSCSPAIRARRATPRRSASALAWEPRPPALDLRGALAGFVGVLIAIVRRRRSACTARRRPSPTRPTMRIAPSGEKRSEAEIIAVHGSRGDAVGARHASADQGRRRPRHVRDLPRRAAPRRAAGGCRRSPRCRSPTCATRLGNLPARHGRADAQRDLRLPRRVRQSGKGRPTCARSSCRAWRACSIGPPYDFTQPYEYNRSRRALGCYHCHQVQ